MADIIDTINALIDEQMAEGETWREHIPVCPHCDRDWHGFPLTKRVAAMHRRGLFDEDYRVAEDDSPVLCPGSDIQGPVTIEASDDYDNLKQLAHFMGMDDNVTIYTLVINLDSEGNE